VTRCPVAARGVGSADARTVIQAASGLRDRRRATDAAPDGSRGTRWRRGVFRAPDPARPLLGRLSDGPCLARTSSAPPNWVMPLPIPVPPAVATYQAARRRNRGEKDRGGTDRARGPTRRASGAGSPATA